jgi:hypothetical protein
VTRQPGAFLDRMPFKEDIFEERVAVTKHRWQAEHSEGWSLAAEDAT